MSDIAVTWEPGDHIEVYVGAVRLERGLDHHRTRAYPCDDDGVPPTAILSLVRARGAGCEWVVDDTDAVAHVEQGRGNITVRAYGKTPTAADDLIERLCSTLAESEPKPDAAQIAFWTYGAQGPGSVVRQIDAPEWSEIEGNYGDPTVDQLRAMVNGFRPGRGGQLILWSGVAGSGKTTALRMLAREWKAWCKLHYIVDPEKFFGSQADYMLQVLLAEGTRDLVDDDSWHDDDDFAAALVDATKRARAQWRLLILEDCGELLRPDASEVTGKALSRLLNTVDGLIGRGLRVLVLVTTNEPVGELHPAVARPGRCAAEIKFESLDPAEANAWRDAHDLDAGGRATIAELYAELEGFVGAKQRDPAGFCA